MLTMKYCLSIMMKKFYIQWSFITRIWFSQNAIMRFMIKNCWSLFAAWSWKHWDFELKYTDILIKIFIDHLNLKYFMISKELTRRQVKWAEKLSEYKFWIIYQSEKQNLKVDALIRMSNVKSVEANDNWKLYQHQMLLSESKFDLQSIEVNQDLTQIWNLNRKLIKIRLKKWFLFRIRL